jgi:hypothetical protein
MLIAPAMLVEPGVTQPRDSYSYQILYTGRTLGYARYPNQQTLPSNKGGPSEIAQAFLDQFKLATKPGIAQIRIAMGDNFSPELFGRSITVDSSVRVHSCDGNRNGFYAAGTHLPKDYFNWDNGGWYIWCRPNRQDELIHAPFSDNVADFLIKAQYDAVVPGKHDFYFGPQYLRQIADYLGKKGVQMLGENMIVTSSLAPSPMNAYPRIPERLAQPCHFNTGRDHECYHTDFGPASLDLPDNVLPWKRQFVLHGARVAGRRDSTGLYGADDVADEETAVKDAEIKYDPLFDADSVQICAEASPLTDGDPAKVLKPGTACFKLVASYVACREPEGKPSEYQPQYSHLIPTCKAIYSKTNGFYKDREQPGTTDIIYLFRYPGEHLKAGLNHMFCANPTPAFKKIFGDPTIPICQPFAVQIPMFWSDPNNDHPASGMASCAQDSSVQCPYALVKRGDFNLAVFGVIDPDVLSNVGMLNTGWLNIRNKRWDTLVQITAPDYALSQTLEFCNASEECRSAPKILMAQMSYARATQLISNSSFSSVFDVVLTQASPEHDTGTIEANYQGKAPRFALTPPNPMSTDTDPNAPTLPYTAVVPQVYVATVTKDQFDPKNTTKARQTCRPSAPKPDDLPCWTISNVSARGELSTSRVPVSTAPLRLPNFRARPKKPICAGEQHDCTSLEKLAKEYLAHEKAPCAAQAQPLTNPAASDPVTRAVLLAMRNALKTDAAKVQTRDLYYPDNLLVRENLFNPETKREELQDQVSRVVWKGDEAIVLHVTGATIRKLLKQSAAFAQLDANKLNTEIEKGRSLITLGIYPDPKDPDTYYINGAAMVDTTLYTIATTDFISSGDTGYANLVPPDVLPAFRVRDFTRKQVKAIAGIVCSALAQGASAELCAQMELGPDYFDDSRQSPFDATSGYSTPQHWRSFTRQFRMPRRAFVDTEEGVQQRPFWSLKLENLDFSQSGLFINHLSTTTKNLAGISNPLIANKGSQNIGADDKVRLVYDYQRGTAYVLQDLSFLYNATTSGPPSLAYNVLGSEAGGTFRLRVPRNHLGLKPGASPGLQRPSWLSFQYSIRYERQLVPPFDTQIALMPVENGIPSVSNLTLQTPVISTIYGRLGLRAESGDTYLETGVEQIDARGLLKNYTIPQPFGPTYNCFPVVSSADLQCVPGNPLPIDIKNLALAGPPTLAVSLTTTAYLTPGAYLNFYWKFPIWSRRDANRADQSFYFTLTNKVDIYFNTSHDTPVQTRYLDKLTPALSFPIWTGLSLTPKVDFILYENKINGFRYRAVQPSAALSYTFSWRQGMDWSRALKYGAQTTTPSPAGSPH